MAAQNTNYSEMGADASGGQANMHYYCLSYDLSVTEFLSNSY